MPQANNGREAATRSFEPVIHFLLQTTTCLTQSVEYRSAIRAMDLRLFRISNCCRAIHTRCIVLNGRAPAFMKIPATSSSNSGHLFKTDAARDASGFCSPISSLAVSINKSLYHVAACRQITMSWELVAKKRGFDFLVSSAEGGP